MTKIDLGIKREYIKILAEREDYLHAELDINHGGRKNVLKKEAAALEWALSVLVPLVKLQEAKIERERMAIDQIRNLRSRE